MGCLVLCENCTLHRSRHRNRRTVNNKQLAVVVHVLQPEHVNFYGYPGTFEWRAWFNFSLVDLCVYLTFFLHRIYKVHDGGERYVNECNAEQRESTRHARLDQ